MGPGSRAAVQLTHGMGEHAQRYDHVARALNDVGFVVYAQDHRGHGASADVDGVVLTGTAAIDLLEGALDLDQLLDLAMFNAPFQPARTDVTTRTYPGARHEILNEINRDEVMAELISWLDHLIDGSGQRG